MRKIISIPIIILMFSCTKETISNALNSINSSNATVSNNDTYLPLNKGNYWQYQIKTDDESAEISKLTVLGIQKKINAKIYQTIQSKTDNNKDTVYYAQDKHNYFVYTNKGTAADDKISMEILFLKDNASIGDTWLETAGTANGFKLRCYGKVINDDETINCSGTTYKHVMHTYIEIRKPLLFTYIVVNRQDFYTAKGIGIIKNRSDILLPANSSTLTNVINYQTN